MRVGSEVKCEECGGLITLDVHDLEEGLAFCVHCGNDQEIETENRELYFEEG